MIKYCQIFYFLPSHELPSGQVNSNQVEMKDQEGYKDNQEQKSYHKKESYTSFVIHITNS